MGLLDDHSGDAEHGRIYQAIERGLYALGPALLIFAFVEAPSIWAAREQAELEEARVVMAESVEYCTKWGMPAGVPRHQGCLRDLRDIRARAEQRLRDAQALDDF